MTDSTSPEVPGPSAAVAKGIALGLGVLLLGGTALLITLLVLREAPTTTDIATMIELQAGEKITDASLFEQEGLFVIEAADGTQKVLLINFTTGARTELPVRTRLTEG